MGKKSEGPRGCMLYEESLKLVPYLSDAEAGRVIKAIVVYFLTGEEPAAMEQTAEKMAYDALRSNVDRSQERYRAICERNRQIRNRGRLAPGEYYVLPDGEAD